MHRYVFGWAGYVYGARWGMVYVASMYGHESMAHGY